MGLSNEERTQGIINVVDEIVINGKLLTSHDTRDLKSLVDKLWKATLMGRTNPHAWLLGTAPKDVMDEPHSVFDVAMINCAEEYRPNNAIFPIDENSEDDKMFNYLMDVVPKEVSQCVSKAGRSLLDDREAPAVYKVYQGTESLFYYTKRYNDDYLESYCELVDIASRIQGECKKIFEDHDVYFRAYCLSGIIDTLITTDTNDIVNQWWYKHRLDQDIRTEIATEKLFKLFTNVRQRKYVKEDHTIQEKIMITLKLLGERYHYEFKHIEFRKMLEGVEGINQRKIDKALKKCIDKYENASEKYREQLNGIKFDYLTHDFVGEDKILKPRNEKKKEN